MSLTTLTTDPRQRLVPTAGTEAVAAALRSAPALGHMLTITGPTGWGKSEALRLAANGLPRLRVVELGPVADKPRRFWAALARGLDLPVATYDSSDTLSQRVAACLRLEGYTLALDHCEHLPASVMPHLRYLVDLTDHLVAVGSPFFAMRLAAHQPLAARTSFVLDMPPVTVEEVSSLLRPEFSGAWIAAAHRFAFGDMSVASSADDGTGWWTIHRLATVERNRSHARSRPTTDAGADDARIAARRLRLTA
mgnify:CR=1 FL=1